MYGNYRFQPIAARAAAQMMSRNDLRIDGVVVRREFLDSKTLFVFPRGTMTCSKCRESKSIDESYKAVAVYSVARGFYYDGLICEECVDAHSIITCRVLFGTYFVPEHRPNLEMQCAIRRVARVRRCVALKRARAARIIIRALRRWVGISRMMNPYTPEGQLHMRIVARKWEKKRSVWHEHCHHRYGFA